jgi:hypothetical protein
VSGSLLNNDFQAVLKNQGISTDTYVGVYGCPNIVPALRAIAGDSMVVEVSDEAEAAQGARSTAHWVLLVHVAQVMSVIRTIGGDVASTVAVIAIGKAPEGGPSSAELRSAGAMDVCEDPSEENLRRIVRRGLEFRALRALELAHRCESRRLTQRELDLLGHPPEHMTDDLSTFQPPPLPVGPSSNYSLEEASEAFERSYIDRVMHLTASAREAATFLDVSAATLARRTKRDGGEA